MPIQNASVAKGTVHVTRNCGRLRVLRYCDSRKVKVKFLTTGYKTTARADQIRKGEIKDPLCPSVFGIGFWGIGKHAVSLTGKMTPVYNIWRQMLHRCYNEAYSTEKPTYKNCTVVEEWHNFQTFATWCQKQVGFGRKNWELDKDILVRNNKVYGPNTCCFVPRKLNALFPKRDACRGEYLIGASLTRTGDFIAQCGDGTGKLIYLGTFTSELSAYRAYKKYKEHLIKSLANKWQAKLDVKVHSALLGYRVRKKD